MNSSPKDANLACKAIREEELLNEISRPTLLTVEEEALPLDHIQLLAVLFTYLFTVVILQGPGRTTHGEHPAA